MHVPNYAQETLNKDVPEVHDGDPKHENIAIPGCDFVHVRS
jgi:hypothetical protein